MSTKEMKITMEEARNLLFNMAPYVELAKLIFNGEEFSIKKGVVSQRVTSGSTCEWKIIASFDSLPVKDLERFLKEFIEFSKQTFAIVDPMTLNTPDAEYHWVLNARASCGVAMVRYLNRNDWVKDPEKDRKTLEKLGFKWDFHKNWMWSPPKT